MHPSNALAITLIAACAAPSHAAPHVSDAKTAVARAIVNAVSHNGAGRRQDARVLWQESNARAAAGDYAGAMGLRLQILEAGQRDASTMGLLGYGATQPLALGNLAPIASHLDARACRKYAARLAAIEAKSPSYVAILRRDERGALRELDSVSPTPEAWQKAISELFEESAFDRVVLRQIPLAAIRANIRKVYAAAEADVARPYGTKSAAIAVDPYTRHYASPMSNIRFLWTRLKTQRLLVVAALIRRADRLQRRKRPTPLPTDPFGVGPLKRRNGLIYSIGPDGKDDSGQSVPNAAQVAALDKGDVLAPTF